VPDRVPAPRWGHSIAPTALRACHASLTVAGLTPKRAARSRTVGRRTPTCSCSPRISLLTAAAIPRGDGSEIASKTSWVTSGSVTRALRLGAIVILPPHESVPSVEGVKGMEHFPYRRGR
jgi:hypothetical protein